MPADAPRSASDDLSDFLRTPDGERWCLFSSPGVKNGGGTRLSNV